MLLAVLRDGTYRKHVESLRDKLAGAMSQAGARLRGVGLTPWVEPRAGMFLWCELPEGLDAVHIARQALAANIVLAPGNVFSPAQTAGRFLRFNVAQCADPGIFKCLRNAIHGSV
jgi:DNA-binding transcriptional MocR family regulator